MRSGRLAVGLGAAGVLLSSPLAAQTRAPGPPGPYVIDVRGATAGIPASPGLYPTLADGSAVPARGFGFDVGGHLYFLSLGPARVGVGANVNFVRGTTSDATASVGTVAPQLSFNFGTSDGWSYLSAGVGSARISAGKNVSVQAINYGGGARWFLNRHSAIGFDLRIYKLAAAGTTLPASTSVSVSVGFSLK
jgi:hypothetical protein